MQQGKMNVIRIGNYTYFSKQVLGRGATGLVYQGYRNSDKIPVAIKVIELSGINTPVKRHLLDCEVNALKSVKHQYVCQAYDILKDQDFYYVPLEFCSKGTLRDYIKSRRKLPEEEALCIFKKIVEGYCAIKSTGIVHRDLKTENILLKSNMDPCIIDFGYCEKTVSQSKQLTYNVGSPAYMSPEAYNDSYYTQKSDIWALGIILHEMLTGTIPIMRTTDITQYFQYMKTMKTAEIIPGIQNKLSIDLLLSSLTVDLNARLTCEQLLSLMNSQEFQGQRESMERKRMTSLNLNNPQMQQMKSFTHLPEENLQNSPNLNLKLERKYSEVAMPSLNFGSPLRATLQPSPQYQQKFTDETSSPRRISNTSINAEIGSPLRPYQKNHSPNSPGFLALRKKITTPSFQIDLTPVRIHNNINPQDLDKTSKGKEIISPTYPNRHISALNSREKIHRTYSSNNLGFSPRFI